MKKWLQKKQKKQEKSSFEVRQNSSVTIWDVTSHVETTLKRTDVCDLTAHLVCVLLKLLG